MNNKILTGLLYFYAIVFSILKTIRLPNQWSQAHWLLDYRFGFIKRGLGGEIFGLFLDKTQNNIFILSEIISFLLYALLLTIAIRQIAKSPISIYRIFFFLIFFLSQYLVYSVHLVGYLDNLIFLMTIIAVQLIKSNKVMLASLLAASCIFIHELSFILMVPICLFSLIVNNVQKDFLPKDIFFAGFLKRIFLFLILPMIAMITLSVHQEFYGVGNVISMVDYLCSSGFIQKNVAYSVSEAYIQSFKSYFIAESPHFIQRVFISKASIIYGIPILFLMFLIYKEFQKVNFKIFLLLAIISLIPLLIHAIAWDTYRIWTFPFVILFLGFWILSSKFNVVAVVQGKLSVFESIILVISVLLTALIKSPLMDSCIERFGILERILISVPVFLFIFVVLKKSPTQHKSE